MKSLISSLNLKNTSPLAADSFSLFSEMTISKQFILDTIKDTAECQNLNRLEKFNVFINVCDNMLAENRITKAQHTRWTNVY